MKELKRTTFPALRCKMGDWVYYVTFLRFSDVDEWVKRTDEIHKSEKLRDMIQREVRKRVNPIVDYLLEQKERFLNALVVGVYRGAPQWFPIEVGTSPVLGSPQLDEDSRASIGLLKFDGEERLFAIDGQHRVVAIKNALKRSSKLGGEEICAIFVSHGEDDVGFQRTRRLFSTLNRYAVPVSKGEIVALSEDDAFAIVTRRLVEEFRPLKSGKKVEEGFVNFGTTAPVPKSDRASLTSLLVLYDITINIHVPILNRPLRKQLEKLQHRRPTDLVLNSIYREQTRYWQLLIKNFPEYQELFHSDPGDKVAGNYRSSAGGHLMFWPAGQQSFARATRIMMDRGVSMKQAVETLSTAPMDINAPPWRGVLWDPVAQRINSKASPILLDSLLLYYIGQSPRRTDLDLLEEYRKVLGDPNAALKNGRGSSKRSV